MAHLMLKAYSHSDVETLERQVILTYEELMSVSEGKAAGIIVVFVISCPDHTGAYLSALS